MKDGTNIQELLGLNAKMCLFLVDDNIDLKNAVLKTSHCNTKMFCWGINVSDVRWIKFKVKITAIGTYAIGKIYLLCFDDRIYIINNGYGGLAFGY